MLDSAQTGRMQASPLGTDRG
ncbi:hypothetical protein ERY430_40961 [Erythrobacter sp. EC-HK427]|nr:hypothetical protein ERY430_40961 [Erythrobacter sp. EC-HK427]